MGTLSAFLGVWAFLHALGVQQIARDWDSISAMLGISGGEATVAQKPRSRGEMGPSCVRGHAGGASPALF